MTTLITEDGKHGANIIQNGKDGAFKAYAVQDDGRGGFEYWYTVGSYKTEITARKYATRSLAKHGYTLTA